MHSLVCNLPWSRISWHHRHCRRGLNAGLLVLSWIRALRLHRSSALLVVFLLLHSVCRAREQSHAQHSALAPEQVEGLEQGLVTGVPVVVSLGGMRLLEAEGQDLAKGRLTAFWIYWKSICRLEGMNGTSLNARITHGFQVWIELLNLFAENFQICTEREYRLVLLQYRRMSNGRKKSRQK